ncbi:MAG: chain-length determining protein [Bacteroidales bacterium]|nr:chain-length determining protein [Bacteroidales bacterium]
MSKYQDFDEFDDFDEMGGSSVDFKPYIDLLLKNWKKLLVWAFCGALFGIMIGFSTPKTYTTKAVVAPEIATRSTLGNGLSSLASLAGVNMNTMALTDAMHPDLYPEIIKSTNFKIALFDMPVTVETKDSLVHTDLYDYMVNYCKAPWWGYVFGLPRMAIEGVKSIFVKKDEFDDAEGHASLDSLRLTKQQEMVVKALSKNITASVEKRTYVLSLKVTMQDPKIAAQLANEIIKKLQDFVVSYRTEKARETVDYYELIYEETRNEYLAAQKAYAYYSDANLGVANNRAKVQLQQLQNEAQLRYQMYNQTAQNLLAARAKVQQEAPVLVVIQPGIAPHVGKPSKVKLAILWFMLGAAACCAWLLIKRKDKIENVD